MVGGRVCGGGGGRGGRGGGGGREGAGRVERRGHSLRAARVSLPPVRPRHPVRHVFRNTRVEVAGAAADTTAPLASVLT
jgi:hypothetical protein